MAYLALIFTTDYVTTENMTALIPDFDQQCNTSLSGSFLSCYAAGSLPFCCCSCQHWALQQLVTGHREELTTGAALHKRSGVSLEQGLQLVLVQLLQQLHLPERAIAQR